MEVKCVLFVMVSKRLNSHRYSDDGDDEKRYSDKSFPGNFGDYVDAKEGPEDFY